MIVGEGSYVNPQRSQVRVGEPLSSPELRIKIGAPAPPEPPQTPPPPEQSGLFRGTAKGSKMNSDITVRVDDGVVNLRVGAVITKDNKVLMVKNPRDDYYYSVGGRIKIGETSEQAIIREVYEELGVKLPIDRLGFISENYFYGDMGDNIGREIYEICFYYYMKTPPGFEPRCSSVTESGITETFEWIPFDTDKTIYPVFFKTELYNPCEAVKHVITDERIKNK